MLRMGRIMRGRVDSGKADLGCDTHAEYAS